MNARAKQEANPQTRAELEILALSYLRLADQADSNARFAELPQGEGAAPAQQQQQPQPEKKETDDPSE